MKCPKCHKIYSWNPEDAILAKVSELVSGDENKGSVLWDRISVSDTSSNEKIWEILSAPNLL